MFYQRLSEHFKSVLKQLQCFREMHVCDIRPLEKVFGLHPSFADMAPQWLSVMDDVNNQIVSIRLAQWWKMHSPPEALIFFACACPATVDCTPMEALLRAKQPEHS